MSMVRRSVSLEKTNSHMTDEFLLCHAPSFVFFDSSGTILKVIEGYDEEVKATLF
jgi:hypothetical protein